MDRIAYICREYFENPNTTQRELAAKLSLSLGMINHAVSEAVELGLLVKDKSSYRLSEKGFSYLLPFRVDHAVIFAAGFGSRFVPLTYDTPKGLLKVHGIPMIERQILQLHEAGIRNITIAVGYLKEKFEYLIDKYDVDLVFNPEYAVKNNLSTLWHTRHLFYGKNTYLLSSDNWIRNNMFHRYEPGSWYSCVFSEGKTKEWCLSLTKKGYIKDIEIGGENAYYMYGPAYLSREFSDQFLPLVELYYQRAGTDHYYWENILMDLCKKRTHLPENGNSSFLYANKQPPNQVYEFENLEELREFDHYYKTRSDSLAMELIARVFGIKEEDIINIHCLKAGMTNKSFLFNIGEARYICRIPGLGTKKLINRRHEANTFKAIKELGISEDMIFFDPDTGYKISRFYEGSRTADASDPSDMAECMEVLRCLHKAEIQVAHSFDIEERIDYYEKLCLQNGEMIFEDYPAVREKMNLILEKLKSIPRKKVLSHIDSVADNFIFIPPNKEEGKKVKLIDWEYAGMADPLIDISMCAIYSYYTREKMDELLGIYLGRTPSDEEENIVYSYAALGGFLWALWTVYKTELGDVFGEYSLKMYRYAKDFFRLLQARGFLS